MTTDASPAPAAPMKTPRRRWWQFSLRSLLIVVLVCCVGTWAVTFLREHYQQGLQEKAAIAWVEAEGGEITYDEEASQNDWRRRWLGTWYPPVVVGVDFTPEENEEDADQRWFRPSTSSMPIYSVLAIEPLAEFEQLENLDLRGFVIDEVEPLLGLTNLRVLRLEGWREERDLEFLAAMKKLEFLELKSKRVSDLTPLAELANLERLEIGKCAGIEDVRPLAGLQRLHTLTLANNHSSWDYQANGDVSALAELKNLERLNLARFGEVEDLSLLGELPKLRSLDLSGCGRSVDLAAVAKLENLEELHLDACTLESLEPLEELKKLRFLDLRGCEWIDDLAAVGEMHNLDRLYLDGCTLNDLALLSELKKLKFLSLYGCNNLADLPTIGALRALEELDLTRCTALRDFTPLASLRQLTKLNLTGTRITNEALAALRARLPECQIEKQY